VIGRRNHFGSKSARGTVVAATMYSLVESAKAAGVDPIAYLVEVATRAKQNPGAVLLPADDFRLRRNASLRDIRGPATAPTDSATTN